MTQFTQLVSNKKDIYLIFAKDENGQDCYFYIKSKEQSYDIIKRSFNKRHMDLTKYGEVVASGWGTIPSEEVKSMLKEKYDFDEDTLV